MPPVGRVEYDKIQEQSYAILKPLVDNRDADAEEYFRFARLALDLGHYEEALQAVDRSIAKGGQEASKSFLKARALAKLGRVKEAILDGENAAALDLENPEFYAFLANLYFNVDSLRLSKEYIDESLYIAPGWVTALQMKAKVYLKSNNVEEAKPLLYQAIENDKESIESYRLLAQCYLQEPGRLDSAIEVNNKGMQLSKRYAEGLMKNHAEILARLGKTDSALKVYQLMQARPHKEPVLGEMAELYAKNGAFTLASKYFVEQIEERPDLKKFYFRAAENLEYLGRYNDAQEIYLRGQGKFPSDKSFEEAAARMGAKLQVKYRAIEL